MHAAPTPRLGGLAVFLSVSLWGLIAGVPLAWLGAGLLVFMTGAWDDIRGLSASWRLASHVAAAGLVLAHAAIPAWMLPLGLLWLVGMPTAFNCLDGLDGLAGTLALTCALAFSLMLSGPAALLACALAGACLGFLPYNRTPARVFLGDGGANFLGFSLAVLGLAALDGRPAAAPAVLLVLALPVWDMCLTTLTRVRSGAVRTFRQWLEHTAQDHTHHLLVARGYSVPATVRAIGLLNGVLAGAGLALFANLY